MKLKLVEFRKAEPGDLKNDSRSLKIGQTYAIFTDNNMVEGIFAIRGDEDPFILKHYLEEGQLWIPNNNPHFPTWIKKLDPEEASAGTLDPQTP